MKLHEKFPYRLVELRDESIYSPSAPRRYISVEVPNTRTTREKVQVGEYVKRDTNGTWRFPIYEKQNVTRYIGGTHRKVVLDDSPTPPRERIGSKLIARPTRVVPKDRNHLFKSDSLETAINSDVIKVIGEKLAVFLLPYVEGAGVSEILLTKIMEDYLRESLEFYLIPREKLRFEAKGKKNDELERAIVTFVDIFKEEFGKRSSLGKRPFRLFKKNPSLYSCRWLALNTDIENFEQYKPYFARLLKYRNPRFEVQTLGERFVNWWPVKAFKVAAVGAVMIAVPTPIVATAFGYRPFSAPDVTDAVSGEEYGNTIVVTREPNGKCIFRNSQLQPMKSEMEVEPEERDLHIIATIDTEILYRQDATAPVPDLTRTYNIPEGEFGKVLSLRDEFGKVAGRDDYQSLTCRNPVTKESGDSVVLHVKPLDYIWG